MSNNGTGINPNFENTNSEYAEKMNALATKAMQDWWNNLSKEQLLQYLADQPNLTADNIRQMLSSMNTVLAFDIKLSLNTMEAKTDFHSN